MKTSVVFFVTALVVCSLLSGCASIVSGRRAHIAIDTYPTNAHVVVHDNDGRAVASLTTPGTVSLKRNRRFFLPAKYTAVIDAPGYESTQVPISSTVNPWILGNAVIGGLPGLIVDNATGAAWQPNHTEIHRELVPLDGPAQQPVLSANESPPPDPAIIPPHVAEHTPQVAAPPTGKQHTVRPASAP